MLHMNGVLDMEEVLVEEVIAGYTQKQLSILVDQTLQRELLSQAEDTRDQARLQSLSLPHAGDWLHVVLTPALCLQLWPAEFRT